MILEVVAVGLANVVYAVVYVAFPLRWFILVAIISRVVYVLLLAGPAVPFRISGKKLRTLIVLGSGGHTAEMLRLVEVLRPEVYTPRMYVIAATDKLGASKAAQAETQIATRKGLPPEALVHEAVMIPRSREVGQSFFTSFFTTLWACLFSVGIVFRIRPDVVLCNGPGTCIPICLSALLLRVLGLKHVSIIYIESIARVDHLSLTGKILYHTRMATMFLVQWEKLAAKLPRAQFVERMM